MVDKKLRGILGSDLVICGRTLQAQYTDQERFNAIVRYTAEGFGVERRCECVGGVACVEFHDQDMFENACRVKLDRVRFEDELSRPIGEIGPQLACYVPHDRIGFRVASDLDVQEMCRGCLCWSVAVLSPVYRSFNC